MKYRKQWNTFFAMEKNIPYASHLQYTKELSQICRASCTGRQRTSPAFSALVKKQLKFIAWKLWLFQGMVLSVLCAVFFCLAEDNYPNWFTAVLPKFLCFCGVMVAMSAIPLLRRSSRYQMMELEQSTRFSVAGILAAQLLFIGIGDLSMLAVLALIMCRYELTGAVVFLSLIVPFMTAAVACMMLWIRTVPAVFERVWAPLCVAAILVMNHILDWYRDTKETVRIEYWGLYVLACLCILYHEYRRLRFMDYAEKRLCN